MGPNSLSLRVGKEVKDDWIQLPPFTNERTEGQEREISKFTKWGSTEPKRPNSQLSVCPTKPYAHTQSTDETDKT